MLFTPCLRFEREISLGQCQTFATKTPLIPRRCFLTRKWLWLRPVVLAKRKMSAGDFEMGYTNNFWVDPKEYSLYILGKRTR